MLDYFLYDGTVVGCFENERLIQATYASGYGKSTLSSFTVWFLCIVVIMVCGIQCWL